MKELKWRIWQEGIEIEGIEMKQLTWMKWHEWSEINEWMNKWMKWQKCLHFSKIFIWNRALAAVSCAFCRPHLPKVLRAQQFFNVFTWKPSSRYIPVHFLWKIFPDRAAKPQKQRTSFTEGVSPFTEKKRRILRRRVLSSMNSRVPNYLMMMWWLTWWLRWWCGYHDGETASHDNRP